MWLIGALILTKLGQVRAAGYLLTAALWAIIVNTWALITGGVRTPAFSANIIVAVLAGMLYGPWGVGTATAATIVTGLVYNTLEMHGLSLALPYVSPGSLLATQTSLMLICSGMLYVATRDLRQILLLSQRELAERRRAEEALAKERALLRTVIDHIPDNIYVKDRQSRFVLDIIRNRVKWRDATRRRTEKQTLVKRHLPTTRMKVGKRAKERLK